MAPISDIERQVYTDIYQTYSGKLYGVCLHYVNDRETAEDLLHDSFIVIFSSLDSLRDSSRLEAWMCSIVRNIACQYLKKAQRITETSIDGTSGKVKMMHAEGSFEHSSNHIWNTVKLPYGNGSYSMYILLPPAEHVTFHADRPFIYLIQEQSSNAIFFIGTKVRS